MPSSVSLTFKLSQGQASASGSFVVPTEATPTMLQAPTELIRWEPSISFVNEEKHFKKHSARDEL